jgi:hypothetical protein
MSDILPIGLEHERAWDGFVSGHALGRARITTAAAQWWRQRRCTLLRLGQWRDGRIVGGAAVTIKSVRGCPVRYARIVAVLPDPQSPRESAAGMLREATELARSHRAIEAEFRAWVPAGPADASADAITEALAGEGYALRREVGGTYLARIDRTDEELLASFDSKCRNQARGGVRKGVTVLPLAWREHVELFCSAYGQMTARKGLSHLEEISAASMLPLVQAGHLGLFGAVHAGRILNIAVVDSVGTAQFSLGATVVESAGTPLPPTGQALQYEIMRHLRDQGRTVYDLGGAPGPLPLPEHPNYTVWRFKHGFNAPYVKVLGTFGRPLNMLGRFVSVVRPRAKA